jgi:hypothetical protein
VNNKNTTQSQLNKLAAFRQSVYGCLTGARDALFELMDAVLTSPGLVSFPELSCAPVFRRQWSSLYEALQDGKLDSKKSLFIVGWADTSLSPEVVANKRPGET